MQQKKGGGGGATTAGRQPRARASRKNTVALAKKGTIPPPVLANGMMATTAASTLVTHTSSTGVGGAVLGGGPYTLDPSLYTGGPIGGPVPILARGPPPSANHPPHQITAATYLSILPPQLLHPQGGVVPPPHAIAVTTAGLSVYPAMTSTSAPVNGNGGGKPTPLILPSTVASK